MKEAKIVYSIKRIALFSTFLAFCALVGLVLALGIMYLKGEIAAGIIFGDVAVAILMSAVLIFLTSFVLFFAMTRDCR